MFLSIATTQRPATDLGFLLMKNPEREHEMDLGFGRAVVLFPEASEARCEAALILEVDPVGIAAGRPAERSPLGQFVNERPYAASSYLSVALNRAYRTAMSGVSRERLELASTAIPLEIVITPLPAKGGPDAARRLFEPLGWRAEVEPVAGPHGPSAFFKLTLRGTARLTDALNQIYVLIPTFDDEKRDWIGDEEVEGVLARAGPWLRAHPERERIVRSYDKPQRGGALGALARLAPDEAARARKDEADDAREAALEAPLGLQARRLDAVAEALAASGASIVADLACGDGRLLARLLKTPQFVRVVGFDGAKRALARAAERLKLGQPDGPEESRVTLLHGALAYRDARWQEARAVALLERIEHFDADRLRAFEDVVFAAARPKTLVVTTPNAEYNSLFLDLPTGRPRHPGHCFEWTRAEFGDWAGRIEERYGYRTEVSSLGDEDPDLGAPAQMAVFSR